MGEPIYTPFEAKGGVFSNTEILEARKLGHIVIEPFNREHLSTTSYDVTLGEYYWTTVNPPNRRFLNPYDKDSIRSYFQLHRALPHAEWLEMNHFSASFRNIPEETPIIVLGPGERILGHTQEFIGIRPPGAPTMYARSTLGRLGLQVCLDAGWGDPGYINRWTMEIYNSNQKRAMALAVDTPVAQIVFFSSGPVDGSYEDRGNYQSGADLEQIMQSWSPEQMLPKTLRIKRVKV